MCMFGQKWYPPALLEELCDHIESEKYFVFIDESTDLAYINDYVLQLAIGIFPIMPIWQSWFDHIHKKG